MIRSVVRVNTGDKPNEKITDAIAKRRKSTVASTCVNTPNTDPLGLISFWFWCEKIKPHCPAFFRCQFLRCTNCTMCPRAIADFSRMRRFAPKTATRAAGEACKGAKIGL